MLTFNLCAFSPMHRTERRGGPQVHGNAFSSGTEGGWQTGPWVHLQWQTWPQHWVVLQWTGQSQLLVGVPQLTARGSLNAGWDGRNRSCFPTLVHPVIWISAVLWMNGFIEMLWSWDSLLVRAPDSWLKDCEFKSRQEWRENFLLQSQLCVLTLIRCPFHPLVTAVAHKRPQSFCQKCCGRLHLNVHTPLTQRSWSGLTMSLSRHTVGIYQETSSHASHQGTLGHSCLSSLSHCGLILA